MDKITVSKFREFKASGRKIKILTAYDYGTAKILNECSIDSILVGDSLGNVKLGFENTLPVTLDDILYHTRAVKRGNSGALLISDMPFMSYEPSDTDAIRNAGVLVKEGGAEAVKIEGGEEMLPRIKAIIDAKIPVMGHIGLTPQSINKIGGYKVQGRGAEEAKALLSAAKKLESAGIFALVLECVPEALARDITSSVSIPTIGIGAGPACDGQILVIDDLLGLSLGPRPKFVKKYADMTAAVKKAVLEYIQEVDSGKFPSEEHTYK